MKLITYSIFSQFKNLKQFTTTRTGGVSSGNYQSLNLGLRSADEKENIQENYNKLCKATGIKFEQFFVPHLTHSNAVVKIDKTLLQKDKGTIDQFISGHDAIITNLPDIFVAVSTADCVPILLFDPKTNAVAAVHAGWKGTQSRILKNTVEAMTQNYGSNPADILAAIGPSISAEKYEVGNELVEAFQEADFDVKEIFSFDYEKPHLDLWKANEIVLLESGIKKEHIEIASICTLTNDDLFFSARRMGIKSGRMISAIGLIS